MREPFQRERNSDMESTGIIKADLDFVWKCDFL